MAPGSDREPRGGGAPPFTATQGQYLAFIYAYARVQGRPPAEADLQRYFRVSPPTVHRMLLTLDRDGHIRRTPGVARSIELLVPPERLPLLREPVKNPVSGY
jgi:DNA-binding MarR family transcriptional regulator